MQLLLRVVLLLLTANVGISATAQTKVVPLQKRIVAMPNNPSLYEYTPAAGDVLIYEVTPPLGAKYTFTVALQRYETDPDAAHPFPIAFKWKMGSPINCSGSVEICNSCYEKATKYVNYFTNGSQLKLTDASSVFMSGFNYVEPEQNEEKKTEMQMDGSAITFYDLLGYQSFPVKVGNRTINLLSKHFNNSRRLDGDNSVVVQVGDNRLILEMALGFSITLKEIRAGN